MQWLTEYVLKSSLRLSKDQTTLAYEGMGYQIHLRDAENATHDEAVIAKVVFEAEDDRENAETVSDQIIERFLDLLTMSTNVGSRVERRTFLLTWEPGTVSRRQFSYAHHTVDDPVDVLDTSILSAVAAFEKLQTQPARPQAFHWFNAALRTPVMLDQFQLFWFVIESLANDFPIDPNHEDKCSCGGVFRCDAHGHPSTRGSTKKRIEDLLRAGNVSPGLIKDLSKIRNDILHGADQREIDVTWSRKNPDFTMERAVQIVAQQAWLALARTITTDDNDIPEGLGLHPPTRMVRLTGASELGLGPCEGGSPEFFDRFPIGTLKVIVTDAPEA